MSTNAISHPQVVFNILPWTRFVDAPFRVTKEGFEQTLALDFYGHALLTLLLLPKIISTGPARIVNTIRSTYSESHVTRMTAHHVFKETAGSCCPTTILLSSTPACCTLRCSGQQYVPMIVHDLYKLHCT